MVTERNCILLVGVISTGKTTATNAIIRHLSSRGIPVAEKPLSDAVHILTALSEDSAGKHHTHPWMNGFGAHDHDSGQTHLPFMVTDNVIPDRMLRLLFAEIVSLPDNGIYRVIEWAGGVNTLPKDHPLSDVDFSYAKGKTVLKDAAYRKVLDRTLLVIDIAATETQRHAFNAATARPCMEEAQSGQGWQREPATFDFFGQDDFYASGLADEFTLHGVPVVRIRNDGNERFFRELPDAVDASLA